MWISLECISEDGWSLYLVENDEKSKSLINAKIQEYLGRSETLKEYLMTEKRGKSATHRVSSSSNLDVGVLWEWFHLYSLTICLQRAIELAQKAIDEDVRQNYPEADKCYKNALDYFMLALKCEYHPNASREMADLSM